MTMFFECFACKKVAPLLDETMTVCPSCGSSNGQAISADRVKQSIEAGAFFNIDPRTGKRAKKKR